MICKICYRNNYNRKIIYLSYGEKRIFNQIATYFGKISQKCRWGNLGIVILEEQKRKTKKKKKEEKRQMEKDECKTEIKSDKKWKIFF